MRQPPGSRPQWSSIASALVILLVVGTIAGFAWRSEGYPAADVDLNDGGVWVTDAKNGLVGNLNAAITELTGAVRIEAARFDVVQDGNLAFAVTDNALYEIDGAEMKLGPKVDLAAASTVALGGMTLASIDPADGKLRVAVASSPAEIGSSATEIAVLGAGSVLTIGRDGTVYVYSTETQDLISYRIEDGAATEVERTSVDGISADGALQITAVGTTPIVLDRSSGALRGPGLAEDLGASADPAGLALQQPSTTSDKVVVATATRVLRQPLTGGVAVTQDVVGAAGRPARPVMAAGCVHSAWQSAYVRICGDTAENIGSGTHTGSGEPVLRTNRDVVVLNDILSGDLWVPKENLKLVDNWDDVIPPDIDNNEHDDDSLRRSDAWTTQDRQNGNRPPVAQDDDLGARPGRATLLTVLDNDSDPDGDVLTVDPIDAGGQVAAARGGTALQITLPADAAGVVSFRYRLTDGVGGEAEANVTVTVRNDAENSAPVSKRVPELVVAAGKSVDYNALNAWSDPDGDAVLALSTSASSPGDEARVLPTGLFTFTDGGQSLGPRDVPITVSDGREQASGTIRIDVRRAEDVLPSANADHVNARVGTPVTFRPLANDVDPAGGQLSLVKPGDFPEGTMTADLTAGTIQITPTRAGSFYTSYVVTNGPGTAQALVRVDVTEAQAGTIPPVATSDLALVPSAGETLVDVLANDTDPLDRVLVVQSVDIPPNSGVNIALVAHRVLRISDSSGITGQVTVHYSVSNGDADSTGTVDILPLPPPTEPHSPAVEPDTAEVRVGDVVTIPVLDNDTHPDGDTMRLVSDIVEPVDPAGGDLFVSQNVLRFKASQSPGTYRAVYAVTDSAAHTNSAEVTIRVRPRDDANNPPSPRQLEARALAGGIIRIPIPLDGIDPDGDSVTLIGAATAPTKGRIVAVGDDWIDYQALDDARGADSFEYAVTDRLGSRAVGRVDVGIAPRAQQNQSPTAADDRVRVRPDRDVSIPVLNNDTDPDGDRVTLPAEAITADAMTERVHAEIAGSTIQVTSPHDPGAATFTYTVADDRGSTGRGTVTVTTDPDAPLLAPIAQDDRVDDADMIDGDGAARDTVDVDVLGNDADPDGTVGALTLSSNEGAVSVRDGHVVVTVAAESQLLEYTVTDEDGLAASAFIRVPGRADAGPRLRNADDVIEIKSGETHRFDLDDLVVVRDNHSPRLTDENKVSALHADASPLAVDATTLEYRSTPGYFGDAAITFEVTDGTGPDDPNGKITTLTVKLSILPGDNQPPLFTGTSVDVGQADSATVELAGLARDPDPGDTLTFDVADTPSGLSATVEGSRLNIAVDRTTAVGSTLRISVTVSDGEADAVPATVEVRVTSSSRPLPIATEDIVPDARAGQAVTVDVLANDFNPFDGEDPLKLVDVAQPGTGSAVITGDKVQVTPAAGFAGIMTVTYRIADATGDPARHATGTITITVKDKPAAPGAPHVETVRNGSVVLSWTPPDNRGAPITTYTVRSNGVSQQCPATTCEISGLRNGQEYSFTVSATNEVGESEQSVRSGPATPDAKPETPGGLTLEAGDGQITATWTASSSAGTPVTSYTVEVSPSPGSPGPTVSSPIAVIQGLDNGTPYQVRVRANNRSPDPSEWSYAATATPSGKPGTPAAPHAERVNSSVNGGVIQVTWSEPDTNGAPITEYDLLVFKDGSQIDSLTKTSTSATVQNLSQTSAYSFAVIAHNRNGASSRSNMSAAVTPYGAPGGVTQVTAEPGDQRATLTWSSPATNGGQITGYQVSINNGSPQELSSNGVITGLTNGTSYTFRVQAVNDAGTGPNSSPTNAVIPFGTPKAPDITGNSTSNGVKFTWDSNESNYKNGRDLRSVKVTIDGTEMSNTGSYTSSADGRQHTLTVDVCATEGGCQKKELTMRAADPPTTTPQTPAATQTVTITKSGTNSVSVTVTNAPAGRREVRCWNATDPTHNWNTNYLGAVSVDIPTNGTFTVTCPKTPNSGVFSLEFTQWRWSNSIQW